MNRKKRETLIIIGIVGLVGYLFFVLYMIHVGLVLEETPYVSFMDALSLGVDDLFEQPFAIFPLPTGIFGTIAAITVVAGALIFLLYISQKQRAHYNVDKVQGDAEFLKKLDEYNIKYTDPIGKKTNDGPANVILSQDLFLSMNTWITRKTLNMLIIGGTGAGKTFFYIGPNIMQANASFVITDPSGGLFKQYGHFLEHMGYKVKCFNLDNMDRGNHYNPFNYIKNDQDIEILVNTLIQNTTPPEQKSGDPFWEKSETALLVALVAYLFHHSAKKMQNFSNVMRLMRSANVDENDSSAKSPLDCLFDEVEAKEGETFAVKQYKTFKMGAGKTLKGILISCAVRLQQFDLEPVAKLTDTDDLDLDYIGDEKTALFVIIPTGDTTFSFLSSMMYSQLFQRLYNYSENTAEYSKCIMDSDKQIWKTFRAQSEVDAKRAQSEAEAFFERAKKGKIIYNEDYRWWEIRTDKNELVGYRGTKELAEKSLEKLRRGKVISNSDQSNSGQRLPIHVRLLLDEFANTGKIPTFSEKVSTIRKYEISVAIVVQSIQQLKDLYKDNWETITGNCDNTLYLGGGTDTVTTEWLSKLLGKETRVVMNVNYSKGGGGQSFNRVGVELLSPSQLRTLPEQKLLILPSRQNAFLGDKYNSTKHPNWALVQNLLKERGAFVFDPRKAEMFHNEKVPEEEVIVEKHGKIRPSDKEQMSRENNVEDQIANEAANNADIDGNALIGEMVNVNSSGDGMEETIPLNSKADANDAIAATIAANEVIWAADEIIYGSAPAAVS